MSSSPINNLKKDRKFVFYWRRKEKQKLYCLKNSAEKQLWNCCFRICMMWVALEKIHNNFNFSFVCWKNICNFLPFLLNWVECDSNIITIKWDEWKQHDTWDLWKQIRNKHKLFQIVLQWKVSIVLF